MSRPRRVLLLCGGRSGEHEVSLASAASVLEAAPDDLAVEPVVITRDGRLLTGPDARAALSLGRSDTLDTSSAAPVLEGLAHLGLADYDAVFPLLHGPNGEDGTVQGLLAVADVPTVGSDVLGSAASMDKIVMKHLFAAAGLAQVGWRAVIAHPWRRDRQDVLTDLAGLGWPRFVKPANLGSSVGISRVTNEAELVRAIDEAFRYDRRVVVEEAAEGAREIEIAVLGNDAPIVSPPGEIRVLGDTFYDYEHKYSGGKADLRIPAPLPEDVTERARAIALRAFASTDAAGLARVDLFYLPDGRLLVNEINTLPGFTRHSMYPRLVQAAGVAYPALIRRLVDLALERHEQRSTRALDGGGPL